MRPYAWAVEYGKDNALRALFLDQATAEAAAVRLHGVLVPLFDIRP